MRNAKLGLSSEKCQVWGLILPSAIRPSSIESTGLVLRKRSSLKGSGSDAKMSLIPFETGLSINDLPDGAQFPPPIIKRYTVTGMMMEVRQKRAEPISRQVEVNGRQVVLWRYKSQVFATSPICPHQASNISAGDIEDLGGINGVCVTCPAHRWKFNVQTGECVNHQDPAVLTTYPAFVDDRGLIFVEFESFDSSLFSSQDF